ncbi:bifunctional glutamate N-acetyltransferase/amino-acid acetyltransferase ArgJ [Azospirillum sp. sgz302134]
MSIPVPFPRGFASFVTSAGIKNDEKDVAVLYSEVPCAVAGVYTRSRFAGPAVLLSREQLRKGTARAVVVTSKNANVATGPQGHEDARDLVGHVAAELGIQADEVQIAATGVIGRRLPVGRIKDAVSGLKGRLTDPADWTGIATAIMTTDTHAKVASARLGDCTITGVAKGVGMIEPNMATLLVYIGTDASIPRRTLQALFKRVMDRTFNCISIDTDTSTSDSAVILANGLAGAVDADAFEAALHDVVFRLMKMILRDGEGVTKVIEALVRQSSSDRQAKTIAKSIVNSPLVKTAIHGNDPNWGRIAMAIGKCTQYRDIGPSSTRIAIGGIPVFPETGTDMLPALRRYLAENDEVKITVDLNTGTCQATAWGCDLSCEYVRFNSSYST